MVRARQKYGHIRALSGLKGLPEEMKVYQGTLVHSKGPDRIEVLRDHVLGFDETDLGKIVFVDQSSNANQLAETYGFDKSAVHTLSDSQFLMPGLVDTHHHPCQYAFTGTGYDVQLLEWLQAYKGPNQSKFADVEYAKQVYPLAVRQTLKHGTTTASYFATRHLESTQELSRVVAKLGQRAIIGKQCSDFGTKRPENTQQSIDITHRVVEFIMEMKNPLVYPMVMLGSARTSSLELKKGVCEIAQTRNLHIQSHMSEQKDEVALTLKNFPGHEHCTSIFDEAGMLGSKTLLAHCIHVSDAELDIFKRKGVAIAHCPLSNFCLSTGIMDARRVLDMGVKVGLGTDVAGGYSSSIFEVMRTAVHASKALMFTKPVGYRAITHHEAFYMGTLGGAQALALENIIGNFEVGKQFDALLINIKAPQPNQVFHTFDQDTMDDVIMKFFYLGDDRNIVKIFVAGKELQL